MEHRTPPERHVQDPVPGRGMWTLPQLSLLRLCYFWAWAESAVLVEAVLRNTPVSQEKINGRYKIMYYLENPVINIMYVYTTLF